MANEVVVNEVFSQIAQEHETSKKRLNMADLDALTLQLEQKLSLNLEGLTQYGVEQHSKD